MLLETRTCYGSWVQPWAQMGPALGLDGPVLDTHLLASPTFLSSLFFSLKWCPGRTQLGKEEDLETLSENWTRIHPVTDDTSNAALSISHSPGSQPETAPSCVSPTSSQ